MGHFLYAVAILRDPSYTITSLVSSDITITLWGGAIYDVDFF